MQGVMKMNIWFGFRVYLKLGPGHRHVHSVGVRPPSQVLCAVAEKTVLGSNILMRFFFKRMKNDRYNTRRHLHSPTNSASSSCLWTKCNILTHGRYLLSAYKARRPVYTSTQRRENLQSCLLQGWLNSKTPLCLHLRLIGLHYNFCSFKGLNI